MEVHIIEELFLFPQPHVAAKRWVSLFHRSVFLSDTQGVWKQPHDAHLSSRVPNKPTVMGNRCINGNRTNTRSSSYVNRHHCQPAFAGVPGKAYLRMVSACVHCPALCTLPQGCAHCPALCTLPQPCAHRITTQAPWTNPTSSSTSSSV